MSTSLSAVSWRASCHAAPRASERAGGVGYASASTFGLLGSSSRLAAPGGRSAAWQTDPSRAPAAPRPRSRASACWSWPTTPPPPWRTTLQRLPQSFLDIVDHIWSATTPARTTPTRWARFRDGSPAPDHRGQARAATSATAATRRPATAGPSSTASTSSCSSTATASTPPSASRTSSPRWSAARPTRCSARGCSTPGGARAGGMPLYKFVGNKILTTLPERASPACDLTRVALRLPRLPRRRAGRPRPGVVLRRLRLRHRDHPGPVTRREADRRGADPDLLRRRDLLRQRHEVRHATSPATCVRHWADERGFGGGVSSAETDAYALKAEHGSHGVLLRLARATARPRRVLDAGCFDGRFADRVRRAGPPRHRPRPAQARGRRRPGRRASSRPTSTSRCPPRSAPTSTSSSPATSSSTSSSRTCCSPTWRHGSRPAARSWSRCPNFGHWYPRGRIAVGRSTTTSAARSTAATSASSPATRSSSCSPTAGCASWSAAPSARPSTSLADAAQRPRRAVASPRGVSAPTGPWSRPGRGCSATSSSTDWRWRDP